jgi:hypothetical protein
MRESSYLADIRRLDPVRDHVRIVHLDACYEFPFDTTRALELAFFRTFAVPSIAQLLASTGEFTDRALKRYDDTDLLISTFAENGYDSAIGRAAIRRMNLPPHRPGGHNGGQGRPSAVAPLRPGSTPQLTVENGEVVVLSASSREIEGL